MSVIRGFILGRSVRVPSSTSGGRRRCPNPGYSRTRDFRRRRQSAQQEKRQSQCVACLALGYFKDVDGTIRSTANSRMGKAVQPTSERQDGYAGICEFKAHGGGRRAPASALHRATRLEHHGACRGIRVASASSKGTKHERRQQVSPHPLLAWLDRSAASFSPDHNRKPGRDHKRDAARPERNNQPVHGDLPAKDKAKQLHGSNERK